MNPVKSHRTIRLPPDNEFSERFILSGGPGGQHVNRTETGVQLRFPIWSSQTLDDATKRRLVELGGSRVDSRGVLTIEAKTHRSQHRNREDARLRLAQLIKQAQKRPRKRIPTRPGKAARQKRLNNKRHRAGIKQWRGKPQSD